jgi:hypothetical protein
LWTISRTSIKGWKLNSFHAFYLNTYGKGFMFLYNPFYIILIAYKIGLSTDSWSKGHRFMMNSWTFMIILFLNYSYKSIKRFLIFLEYLFMNSLLLFEVFTSAFPVLPLNCSCLMVHCTV